MMGIGRRKEGRPEVRARRAPAPPAGPPPPPAVAAAGAGGSTTFAFPAPHPDETIGAAAPKSGKTPDPSISVKDVGVTIVAIAVIVAARVARGAGFSAYGLGQSFGVALAGLLVAYGARQLYLRISGKQGPAWSLSLIPIAAAVGLIGQFTLVGAAQPPDEDAVRGTLVSVEGFDYQAAPAGAVAEIERFLGDLPEVGDELGAVEARILTKAGRPAGVVMVVGIQPDALRDMDPADFRAGLQASSGGQVVEKKRGPAETFELQTGPLYAVIFLDEDGYIFTVQGFQKRDAVHAAKRLAAANL